MAQFSMEIICLTGSVPRGNQHLVEGEYSVGRMEEKIGVHQPHLSQHLTVLRSSGIVETRRDGKQIFYRLTEEKAAQLVASLYDIFCVEKAK